MLRSIVVFSHLRWDSVFQRPHHLASRFARDRELWFVEEPIYDPTGAPSIVLDVRAPHLTVCQPYTNVAQPGFNAEQIAVLERLVAEVIGAQAARPMAAWLYTPMAVALAHALDPEIIVYDCMDELSAFLNAPRELGVCESQLMASADLVFTGGPSLFAAKRPHHPRVHCFPSSVDAAHFRTARSDLPEAADQVGLRHPRLGFYGVIDERLDRDLLAALAAAHPEWQIVLVGPVVKIDPADLPSAPNLHYLGARSYADLPSYLAGWDVCLLPFARNRATEFISPTKTLEYMAAELPIVSTSIRDVVEPYGEVVYIGDGDGFITACERALRADAAERAWRRERMRAVVERTSWDQTVEEMLGLAGALLRPQRATVAARRELGEVQP